MPRPKGSGVLKKIEAEQTRIAAEQSLILAGKKVDEVTDDPSVLSAFEIRRTLYTGAQPVRARHVELFLRWRILTAQCKDCAERLKVGKGEKRAHKRFRELERARDLIGRQFWNALRESCGSGVNDAEIAFATLTAAARQADAPAA